jgi:hypothetical protein
MSYALKYHELLRSKFLHDDEPKLSGATNLRKTMIEC